ncbi:MAG: hypothetical protein IPJ30_21755 [Acidobacteria bacterium]|nr:hypothetical protein [Acidobacteriota bacterium]
MPAATVASITNVLGQLIRVDEPTGIGSDPNADLGAIDAPNHAAHLYTYNVQGNW